MRLEIRLRDHPPVTLDWPPPRSGCRQFSSALICPICLQGWAVLELASQPRPWHVRGERCAECLAPNELSHEWEIPGSLVGLEWFPQSLDIGLLERLPPELIKREFDLHLRSIPT